jgi:hypothetical protein
MTTLRSHMRADLQRRGLAPKTPQCSVAAVQQRAQHDRRAPDHISEAELRQYGLFLLNEQKVAESTFRSPLYGIRLFYALTRQRPWPVFDRVRPRTTLKLPVVWSPQEVRSLLAFRTPECPHVSADDLRLWAASAGRDAAAGLRSRPPTPAGPGPTGQGGPRSLGAIARTDSRAVTSLLAGSAAPALGVPRPAPANAPVCDHPPEHLHSGRAPAPPRHRRLHPHAPALLRHPSVRARGIVARHPGPPRPQTLQDHRPLHASDDTHPRQRARGHQHPDGRSRRGAEAGHARGGGRLAARWA